jgi:hypothetical protein
LWFLLPQAGDLTEIIPFFVVLLKAGGRRRRSGGARSGGLGGRETAVKQAELLGFPCRELSFSSGCADPLGKKIFLFCFFSRRRPAEGARRGMRHDSIDSDFPQSIVAKQHFIKFFKTPQRTETAGLIRARLPPVRTKREQKLAL